MQKTILAWLLLLTGVGSCDPDASAVHRDDPVEAGREFIEASLKGNYVIAKKYVLPDSLNMQYFDELENFNRKLSSQEKNGYKNANIIIDSIQTSSDSVTIIHYSNTFKKTPAKIRLVKSSDGWFVDFKFTFSGNP